MRHNLFFCCVLWIAAEAGLPLLPAAEVAARQRAQPVALALAPDQNRLVVANSTAGSLTQIDLATNTILSEWRFPQPGTVNGLSISPNGRYLLATRGNIQRVTLLQRLSDTEFTVLGELSAPLAPQGVSWFPDGRGAAVTCQWSQRVLLLDIDSTSESPRLQLAKDLPLEHLPREMLWLGDTGQLLVADAFTGQFSVVAPREQRVERTLKVPGHNFRGLGWLPKGQRVVVAHQILNQLAETSKDGVFWGLVMTNNIRLIDAENFINPKIEPLYGADIHFLGEPRSGAGDPEGVAVTPNETMLIALGGVDEVAIGQHIDHNFERVKVGKRPTAVVADVPGKFAYVANTFGDSVSVIDIPRRKLVTTIPLRPEISEAALSSVERGERLYYDARLSLDSWYSCHSCHSDGHTVSLLNDNLGDGDYGAPKRIPSLFGVGETGPWLWSGRRSDLLEQSQKSINTTMHGPDASPEQLSDLVDYLKTLPAPPRIVDADPQAVRRGELLFESRGCAECHVAPTYTSPKVYDVGIKDQLGRDQFNPPSLRGVRYRGEFFHDHRAKSLPEVFRKHQHPREQPWSDVELADLIAFLRSL